MSYTRFYRPIRQQHHILRNCLLPGAGVALLLLFGQASQAQSLYSNFPPQAGRGSGQAPDGPGNPPTAAYADPFAPTSSGLATGVEVGLSVNVGVTTMDATLYTNSGGLPGTAIATAVLNVSGIGATGNGIVSGSFGSSVNLTAGQTYWLGLAAVDGVGINWEAVASGATVNVAENVNNSGWVAGGPATLGAFQINGTPAATPEPGTLSLLAGMGGSALALLARKRRRK